MSAARIRKRWVYGHATDIVANSAAGKQDLERVFGIPPEKISVLHNCLPDVEMPAPAAPERSPLIVCAGRLHPSKGQDVLLRAAAILVQKLPGVSIEFLGGGPWLESLRETAGALGVSGQCVFKGGVAHDEVLRRMSLAVATAVPSRSEAFGLVNIESLAVGTPVVASAVGGIPEVIRDGYEGFLVPAGDPVGLADRLYRLLADPALRDRMSRNARARFLSDFEQGVAISRQVEWLETRIEARLAGA
jgi:glycosyltransferase involved in cell wall biosynthesis